MATASRKRSSKKKAPSKAKEKTFLLTLTREQWQEVQYAINWMAANRLQRSIKSVLEGIDPQCEYRYRALNLIKEANNSTHWEFTAEEALPTFAVIVNGIYLYNSAPATDSKGNKRRRLKHIDARAYGAICATLNGSKNSDNSA